MSNSKVFDENGNEIDIKGIIKDYIKNNLSINISTRKEYGYGFDDYKIVQVELNLEDIQISYSQDSI